jgi:hypothetical protein
MELSWQNRLSNANDQSEHLKIMAEVVKEQAKRKAKIEERRELVRINNCIENRPGWFYVTAPPFGLKRATAQAPQWTVLDADFRETLTNKYVKPTDPVLRLGDTHNAFEVELKIPQKHIGQVLSAFDKNDPDPRLFVDILLTSAPTRTFKGILYRSRIAGEATPNRDDHNESAPVVIAYVSLDDPAIPEDQRVPPDLFVTGVEVHAKIRCGNHAMGYSLFYGLWEFLYEKVVFFF